MKYGIIPYLKNRPAVSALTGAVVVPLKQMQARRLPASGVCGACLITPYKHLLSMQMPDCVACGQSGSREKTALRRLLFIAVLTMLVLYIIKLDDNAIHNYTVCRAIA